MAAAAATRAQKSNIHSRLIPPPIPEPSKLRSLHCWHLQHGSSTNRQICKKCMPCSLATSCHNGTKLLLSNGSPNFPACSAPAGLAKAIGICIKTRKQSSGERSWQSSLHAWHHCLLSHLTAAAFPHLDRKAHCPWTGHGPSLCRQDCTPQHTVEPCQTAGRAGATLMHDGIAQLRRNSPQRW